MTGNDNHIFQAAAGEAEDSPAVFLWIPNDIPAALFAGSRYF